MAYDPTATKVKSKNWVPNPTGVYPKDAPTFVTNVTVYIAGPMRGIPYFNASTFDNVAETLRENGYTVFNPVDNDVAGGFDPYDYPDGTCQPEDFDLKAALTWDLARVMEVDAVVTLSGVDDSKGAAVELALARAIGTRVVSYYELMTNNFVLPAETTGFVLNEVYPAEGTYSNQSYPNKLYSDPGAIVWDTSYLKPYSGEEFVEHLDNIPKKDVLEDDKAALSYYDKKLITDLDYTQTVEDSPPEQNISVSATGGRKEVKDARFDLIPSDALRQLAEHYGKGAHKYEDNQWRKGYEWSKSYASLIRHANQYWNGEDFDAETGSNHMAAVAWHALTLLTFYTDFPNYDDRYTTGEK